MRNLLAVMFAALLIVGCGDDLSSDSPGSITLSSNDAATDGGVNLDGVSTGDTGSDTSFTSDAGGVKDAGVPDATLQDVADGSDVGDSGDASGGSCKDRCGEYDKDLLCQCDNDCKKVDDCCEDFEKICSVVVPDVVIGDSHDAGGNDTTGEDVLTDSGVEDSNQTDTIPTDAAVEVTNTSDTGVKDTDQPDTNPVVDVKIDDTSDGGLIDAAEVTTTTDAGVQDTGPPDTTPSDAGAQDAGQSDTTPSDAGTKDAGQSDTTPSDVGAQDAGQSDTTPSDAGEQDSGQPDTTTTDSGPKDAGCVPACKGKECGGDGCGGTCGVCKSNSICDAKQKCFCIPSCKGKQCGADGCGDTCGSCKANYKCSQSQCISICIPSCKGKQCGGDGCGGSCGSCKAPKACDSKNQCVCEPQCKGKQCGGDGCGGSCGSCKASQKCDAKQKCVIDCSKPEMCLDGIDNDCNGKVDSSDSKCLQVTVGAYTVKSVGNVTITMQIASDKNAAHTVTSTLFEIKGSFGEWTMLWYMFDGSGEVDITHTSGKGGLFYRENGPAPTSITDFGPKWQKIEPLKKAKVKVGVKQPFLLLYIPAGGTPPK